MPPVWNARRMSCPIPSSERAQIPNALHSGFMNTPNVEFLNIPLCSAPMSYLAGSKWGRLLCYWHAATRWCSQRGRGVSCLYLRYGDRDRLQNVSPPSVLVESSQIFFTIHRRHRRKKMMDQNFEIQILRFLRFFNYQKGVAQPSAADLDHYGRGQTRSQ